MSVSAPTLHSPAVRFPAQVLSFIFHPLFIPGAVAAWLLFQHPIYTLLLEEPNRVRLLAMVLLNTILFPGLIVVLLWRLGFTSGVQLTTQRERIIPLIVSIIFYFWAWYVSRNLENVPTPLVQWLLGVFLCSCAAMFTNIFFKMSLHTLGMGGMVTFATLMMANDPFWPVWVLPAGLFAAGLTGTARLAREAHEPGEIYGGYLAGAICQLAAWYIAG